MNRLGRLQRLKRGSFWVWRAPPTISNIDPANAYAAHAVDTNIQEGLFYSYIRK